MREKKRGLLEQFYGAMPAFAHTIAVIDAIPPTRLADLVGKIVHRSIVSEHEEKGSFGDPKNSSQAR